MKKLNIPQGDEKESVYLRKGIIISELYVLINTTVKCPALNNNSVEFLFYSIDETATRASQSYLSTLAALRVVEAIKKAKFIKTDLPNSNRQRKMNFKKMHELRAFLKDIGEVKIMIGERNNKRFFHYCITKKQK